MSAQINLYHPRFLKQRDALSLNNVAAGVGVVYLLLLASGGWAWHKMQQRRDAASVAEAQLKALRDQIAGSTKALAQRKPDPRLQAEIDGAEAALRSRAEIAKLLEGGALGSTQGFAEILRGFARQAPEGLWLTGFSIGNGAQDIEIRGSTLDPSLLPDYIRRLGGEKAFQGRSFAALTMNRPDPPPAATAPAGTAQARVAMATQVPAVSGPRPVDFVLQPRLGERREGAQ